MLAENRALIEAFKEDYTQLLMEQGRDLGAADLEARKKTTGMTRILEHISEPVIDWHRDKWIEHLRILCNLRKQDEQGVSVEAVGNMIAALKKFAEVTLDDSSEIQDLTSQDIIKGLTFRIENNRIKARKGVPNRSATLPIVTPTTRNNHSVVEAIINSLTLEEKFLYLEKHGHIR